MEYTVQKLGKLAGISTRTLRYYDEIGILKPARINSSGYRIYGQEEVDLLQQILFFRELGFPLDKIGEIVTAPSFDSARALRSHYAQLLDRRKQLDVLITNVEHTIAAAEGRTTMTNQQKFEGFKQQLVNDNEKQYGEEIRQKFGDDAMDQSNRKLMGMTQEQYDEVTRLEGEVKAALAEAFKDGDPASESAQKAADLHKQWLSYHSSQYSKEAHAGIAQMYVDDERFKAYYDAEKPGTAEFLRDAVLIYTGMKP
ncbi:MerR family transcriptional regulator [Paenibacillus nasutitermitis]|uniref:MerR family transcriptional regulator n=1 Tax=Paenibacillus nasutitermitis TaxID=1652958 RepID=A0A916ZAT4_9BACL|nr:MerR family transcriptional regulator [Paenibacillus nasutitermitis]GGD84398.1 MerR family transcriptional regulator [Paenibacillus nasutitermitis]